jgi:hypothetical protein
MPLITFIGDVTNDNGAAIHLSIAGPNHFSYNRTYDGSFQVRLEMPDGYYYIFLTCYTSGDFEFNVEGKYTSVSPQVPDKFKDKHKESYDLEV